MKRAGFTMIELIFVIVILGILAAVAIPKLAATRDDANIAKGASAVSTLVSDLGSYYTAKGSFGKWGEMTNVVLYTTATGSTEATTTTGTTKVYYHDSTPKGCVGFIVSSTDGNLTVTADDNSTATCKGINTAANNLMGVHTFGGSGITW